MHSFSTLVTVKSEWSYTPGQNRHVMLSFRFQPKQVRGISKPGPVHLWGSPLAKYFKTDLVIFNHRNYRMISPLTSKPVSFILPSALPHGIPLVNGNYSLTDSSLRSVNNHRQKGISKFGGHFLQVEQITNAIMLPEETVLQTLGRERARPLQNSIETAKYFSCVSKVGPTEFCIQNATAATYDFEQLSVKGLLIMRFFFSGKFLLILTCLFAEPHLLVLAEDIFGLSILPTFFLREKENS